MSIINKVKLLLAKIKIAQLSYKKILKVSILSMDLILLNKLWEFGFIYGYNKINNFIYILLKYNLRGLGLINSVIFFNIILSKKALQSALKLDPLYSYLVMTTKGIMFYSIKTSEINYGGVLIAKM